MTDRSDSHASRRDLLAEGLRLGALVALASGAGALPGCALFIKTAEPDLVLQPVDGALHLPRALLPWEQGGRPWLIVAVAGTDDKLLLLRAADGEVDALTTTCTHRGCDVGYDAARNLVVCPCHGSEYDVHGGNVLGPAKRPLRRYSVQPDADGLVVRLD
jgi:nitrite reductase/ring-hydroxylating ferredoxin subunit